MTKKTIKAPLSYDPGKGRPKEHLAYLNWQEMQELQRINGGNMERGPKGLPSFPPADARGSSSKASSSSSRGGGPTSRQGSSTASMSSKSTGGGPTSRQGSSKASIPSRPSGGGGPQSRQGSSRASMPSRSIGGGPTSRQGRSVAIAPSRGISAAQAYRPSAISPGGLASPGVPSIARAMTFPQSLAGVRDPKLAGAIKDAALSNQSLFSVKGATPQQQTLIDRISPTVLQVSMDTGLDPRTIIGQALTESTTGKHESKVSKLARDANNLFGVKATGEPNQFWSGDKVYMPTKEVINGKTVTVKEPFRRYDSPEQALMDYGRLMQTKRYSQASQYASPEDQLKAIRGGGFATHGAKSYVDMGVKNVARISVGGDRPKEFDVASAVPASSTPTKKDSGFSLTAALAPIAVKTVYRDEAEKMAQQAKDYIKSGVDWVGQKIGYVSPTGAPTQVAQASVSPSQAGLTDEQLERVRERTKPAGYAIRGGSMLAGTFLPGAGLVGGFASDKYKKNVENRLNEYAAATPSERAALEAKDPALIGWSRVIGETPQTDYSVYQKWAEERGLRGPGESRGGDRGVQYAGGIGSLPSGTTAMSGTPSTPSTTATPSGVRPYEYYQWDVGVNIPSPTDPNYTSYQEYLRRRAAARTA